MKKILSILFVIASLFPGTAAAATPAFTVTQGGTGTGTPWMKYPLTGNASSTLIASSTLWLVGVNATGTTDALASTFTRARTTYGTTTFATSTALFATTASTTNLFGSNLAACSGSSFLQWTAGLFGCASPTVAAAWATTSQDYYNSQFRDWSLQGSPIYLAPTTTRSILVNSATSTITNLMMVNGTTTNATSTNFSVANMTATGSTTLQSFTAVNATTSAATTTSLYVNSGGISTTGSTTLQNFTGKQSTTTNATTSNMYSSAAITSTDNVTSYFGKVSPIRNLNMNGGTSTATMTGTTSPGVDASIPIVAPFAGTIKKIICNSNSFLGVTIKINSTSITPSYFIASGTRGTITVTANNSFVVGDLISAYFGTTTTATASPAPYIGCAIFTTETP